jgi:hypothetical protein
MSKQKKSRAGKKHRPLPLLIPKLIPADYIRDQEPMLALRIYARIESFLTDPTIEAGNHLCEILCQIAAGLSIVCGGAGLREVRDEHSIAVVSAIAALEDVSLRHRKNGDVSVRATEAMTLRAAAGKLDEALGRIPVHAWNEGCMDVRAVTAKIDLAREQARREVTRALALEAA